MANEEIGDYEKWEGDIVYELEKLLDITTSDAQGIVMAQPFRMMQYWVKGLNPKATARIIEKESRVK